MTSAESNFFAMTQIIIIILLFFVMVKPMIQEGDLIRIKKIVRWGEDAKEPEGIHKIIVECDGEIFTIAKGSGAELWGDSYIDNGLSIEEGEK